MKIIYGFHAIYNYLLNNDNSFIDKLYLSNTRDDNRTNQIIDLCNEKNIHYICQEQKFLNNICDKNHQGFILSIKNIYINRMKINELDKSKSDSLVVVLDGITDPHNLGAILRSAECFGVDAVILPKDNSANVENEIVAKVSCGAVYHIPIIEVTNLSRAIDELKDTDYWVYGTALSDNSKSMYDVEYNGRIAVVVGNEGKGIRRIVKNSCDYLIKIPILGETQSLNVSVATGIILSHISYRQKQF
jgi:23S rRNA (guanosine2251-2'-O)-methyltransferase